MRDKRPVDELSIEELERVLAIKRREARQSQLNRMKRAGRVVATPDTGRLPVGRLEVEQQPAEGRPTAAIAKPEPGMPDVASPPPKAIKKKSGTPQFEDDVDFIETRKSKDDEAWRRFVNSALLLVEVAAVFGLIFIAVNMFGAINTLEAETEAAQQISSATLQAAIPTLEPTATLRLNINDFVLPTGHTVDENGQVQLNWVEIENSVPTHLLPMIQQQLTTPVINRPPPTDETPLKVIIPALNLDEPITQGVDEEALRRGVGQVLNGATPDRNTENVILGAHNDIYGELFRDLDKLKVGDIIHVQTRENIYTYTITGYEIVNPNDVHVMSSKGKPTVTLVSCYPYRVNNKRYIVYAERTTIGGGV